jgi:nucleoid-associated protein YgaU
MTAPLEIGYGRPRVRAATRVTAIVGIEAVSVVVLHQLGRYPWMRIDWSDIGHWLETSAPEDVLLGITRTVGLGLAWWLLLSSLLYVGAALTGTPRAVRSIGWTLLPVVRRLLDGALALSLAGTATMSTPTTEPTIASAAGASAVNPPVARPPESVALKLAIYRAAAPLPSPDAHAVTYEVAPGDSLWEIAERQLGDPMRWTEIWDLNRVRLEASGATSPQVLHVGWVLELPGPEEPVTGSPAGYTVRPGDTLWSIADSELGDPARLTEIVALNAGRPQPDGGTLTDPDVIRPGWQLDLPTQANDPPAPPSVPDTPEPLGEPGPRAPDDSLQPESTHATEPGATEPTPPPTTPPTAPDGPPCQEGSATPGAPPVESAESGDDQQPSSGDTDASPTLPIVAGLTGATVLATGVMLHLRRLRRRRTTVTARTRATWRPRPTDVEQAVVATADVPLVRWAGQELAALAARLRPRDLDGAAPVAIELSTDAGIEMLWDRPVPHAPPSTPWSVRDGGWAWALVYDPDAPVPADSLPAPLPALVTIGERDGRQLLLDLEAYGSLAITGDPTRVADFGCAVALDLATDDDLADAFVSTVGIDVPGAAQLTRLNAVSTSQVHGALRATVTSVTNELQRAHLTSSFELRVGRDAPHLETVAVIADAHAPGIVPAELVAASPARRGTAIVVLGEVDASAKIVIASDGSARLDPLGVDFRAAALPPATHEQLDQLLADEAALGDVPPPAVEDGRAEPADAVRESDASGNGHEPSTDSGREAGGAGPLAVADTDRTVMHDAGSDGESTDADNDSDPRDGRIVVRVLGPPRVEERPEMRRRELILVVYLACRGGSVHASSVQHAIWGGRAVQSKTLWNLVARARAAIGTLNGEPVMPPADRSRTTLSLSERVTTDLAVFRWLYGHALSSPSARAIELLQEALALVEGEPFDAPGYDWAHHDHQYVAEASALIEQAVEQLVDLATQAGDVDIAREALVRGLRGLPGNEVLYRARMRLEHDAGNLAGIKTAWDELVAYLDDLYAEPSEATELLYRELMRSTKR